jgi:hypothetical protein
VVNPVLGQCFSSQEEMPAGGEPLADVQDWRAAGRTLARNIRDLDAWFNQLFTIQITAKEPLTTEEAIVRLRRLTLELQQATLRRDPE